MISYLKWNIKELNTNSIIIITDFWIWYEIIINELIFSYLQWKKNWELYIYHHIVENWQFLFWFLEIQERIIFKELIKISWIGGRVAQSILSLWIKRLKTAIIQEDLKTIESIKWVWKKASSKIVMELKDKDFIKNFDLENINTKESSLSNIDPLMQNEIIQTLSSMWYDPKKVWKILYEIPKDKKSIDQILSFIIKNI